MLVLTRRKDQRISIGPDIQVVILAVHGNRVRLGLTAPAEMPILREELPARAARTLLEEPVGFPVTPIERTGALR